MKIQTVLARGGLVLLTLAVLGVCTFSIAQPLFTMDAAAFQQKDDQVYLEVYLMIQRSGLKFVKADTGFQAPVDISLELLMPDSQLSIVAKNLGLEKPIPIIIPLQILDRVDSLEQITPRQKLPEIIAFKELPPGQYTVIGHVRDINRDTTYTSSLGLNLKSFSTTALAISDLELSTRLEKTAEKSKFWKNGFLVVPNPERIYGAPLYMLYYYCEIYNLNSDGGMFTVDRVITDDQGKAVKKLPQKSQKRAGTHVVEVDGISIASLRSGAYRLNLTVTDSVANTVATTQTRFFVFRPEDYSQAGKQSGLTKDEEMIMSYDADQLKEATEGIKFLLSDGEWRSLETLNIEGKRRFLVGFWKNHDPDPTTPENEFKQLYEERKRIASQRFSYFNRDGWQTDRGRIFILYGVPDHIEPHTHDMETRPYEIWNFDSIDGGVIFVFVDHNNFGDFRLVHSTKNGEVHRPNWFNEEAAIQRK
jgi:GWxTD domain-containing protein